MGNRTRGGRRMNKDIKTMWTIGGILLVCFCIFVSISGYIDNSSTTPINNSSTTYQKNIMECPNPECPLHDPNNTDDGNYGTRGRHIHCPECNQTDSVEPIGLVQHGPYKHGGETNGHMIFYCKNDGCIFEGYSS